eukprot:TRINITY_DN40731_c0_g1_i1.p1 TRINITY_DN40731_c0_g1~~TRINITY_DN40731_c0_g1_i1.p1  ORF type:complete len:525 (+),score=79.93 TRINITY_DN40731_c0_g1_i1:43-1617(+)
MSIVSWSKGALIGQGGYGKVYLCINNATGGLFAVKDIVALPSHGRQLEELENEISVLSHLSHPQIVTYLGARRSGNSLSIFMEYVPGGSLADILNKFGVLAEAVTVLYTNQLLLGLEYLHQMQYVHRDLKAANVLVGIDGRVKLSDFGTALKLRDICQMQREERSVGTMAYMPPERARKQLVGPQTDIWALGCMVLEMLTGSALMNNHSNHLAAVYAVAKPVLPETLSENARDFLDLCFGEEQVRPCATRLRDHSFVTTASPVSPSSTESELPPPSNFATTHSSDFTEDSQFTVTGEQAPLTEQSAATASYQPSVLQMPPPDVENQRTGLTTTLVAHSRNYGKVKTTLSEYLPLLLLAFTGSLLVLGISSWALVQWLTGAEEFATPVAFGTNFRRLLHVDNSTPDHFHHPAPAFPFLCGAISHCCGGCTVLIAIFYFVVRRFRAVVHKREETAPKKECNIKQCCEKLRKKPAELCEILAFLSSNCRARGESCAQLKEKTNIRLRRLAPSSSSSSSTREVEILAH